MNLDIIQKGKTNSSHWNLIQQIKIELDQAADTPKDSIFYIEPDLSNISTRINRLIESKNEDAKRVQGFVCRSFYFSKFDYQKIEVFKSSDSDEGTSHILIAVISKPQNQES